MLSSLCTNGATKILCEHSILSKFRPSLAFGMADGFVGQGIVSLPSFMLGHALWEVMRHAHISASSAKIA